MLSSIFHHYIQRTKTLCLYGIQNPTIHSKLIFPQATTLALVHCSRDSIQHILSPTHFPNLKTIHYLSAHPGKVDIYRTLPSSVSWVFPNQNYIFYQCMMEAGIGHIDPSLVRRYVHRIHRNNGRTEVDLILPELGVYKGPYYRIQFARYLSSPYHPVQHNYLLLDTLFTGLASPDLKEDVTNDHPKSPMQSYIDDKITNDFFEGIMNDCEKEEKLIKNKM
jgi:hypothetical protein